MSTEAMSPRDWLKALGVLVATSMSISEAKERLDAYAPLLAQELDKRVFCAGSLRFVARRCKFFPAYAELCGWLAEWWKDNKPATPALPDNLAALTADERRWLAYWHQREREGFAPLREPDGRLSRPDVRDWRAHAASMVRRYAPRVLELVAA